MRGNTVDRRLLATVLVLAVVAATIVLVIADVI
jgi:hypothetical protein